MKVKRITLCIGDVSFFLRFYHRSFFISDAADYGMACASVARIHIYIEKKLPTAAAAAAAAACRRIRRRG